MLEILRRALPLLPLSAAQQFTRLLLTMLLAQWMTPTHFGAFATLYALIEILIQPATLGFAQAIVRFGVGYFRRAEYALLQGLHSVFPGNFNNGGHAAQLHLTAGHDPVCVGQRHPRGLVLFACRRTFRCTGPDPGRLLIVNRTGQAFPCCQNESCRSC